MLGYALAKLNFPGKRVMFGLVLATLMVPGVVTFVPLFVLVSNLGMVNSYAGLILPFLAGPFGVFLMRQFMLGLPDELHRRGPRRRSRGVPDLLRASCCRCASPRSRRWASSRSSRPGTTSCGRSSWRSTEDKYTLPVALAIYAIGENKSNYGLLMAGSVAIIVPVLIVFIALQKHFVRGIATDRHQVACTDGNCNETANLEESS